MRDNACEVEVPISASQQHFDAAYEDALSVLSTKPPKKEPLVDQAVEYVQYYESFRTNILLTWLLSNVRLALNRG